MNNHKFGKVGEIIACRYLQKHGFTIIETNFYTKWGEIDIIAYRKQRWHFVEVKTRTNLNYGRPEEAVTKYKWRRTKRAVIIYLNQHNLRQSLYQIDVLSILYNQRSNKATIRFFQNITFS